MGIVEGSMTPSATLTITLTASVRPKIVFAGDLGMTISVVVKPWAPCSVCKDGKVYKTVHIPDATGVLADCPICHGTGNAEFCTHVWVAHITSYCVKCHTFWEERFD